jgi:hypothetical protein
MSKTFVIEDQLHCEWVGQFAALEEAWIELERRSTVPWNERPNAAPCQSWRTCGRDYEIIEYETSSIPWREIQRYSGLEVSAEGVVWGLDAPGRGA